MDAQGLYREDVFTDQRVGTIRRLTPVTPDGAADPSRPVQYIGQASVMTPMGSLPLSFELDGRTLSEAVAAFGAAAQHAVEEAAREIQEMAALLAPVRAHDAKRSLLARSLPSGQLNPKGNRDTPAFRSLGK